MKSSILVLIFLILAGCSQGDGGSYPSTQKFIQEYVPDGARRIEYKDTHGGFHGDGKLWVVYQLGKDEQHEFEEKIKNDISWIDLPVFEEARSFIAADWVDAQDGKYFFHDFQPDWYQPHNRYSGPVFERGSFNFCLFVYNRSEGRIYVYNLDT